MCGYNALAFKSVDDTDIKEVEKFIREQSFNILAESLENTIDSKCEILLNSDQLIEFFGKTFENDPSKFEFLPGDIKTIKTLVTHVKQIVDGPGINKGLKHFEAKQKNKKFIVKENKMSSSPNDRNDLIEVDASDSHRMEVKEMLLKKLKNYLKSFNVNDQAMEHFDENIVSVTLVNNSVVGDISCVICKSKNPKKKEK